MARERGLTIEDFKGVKAPREVHPVPWPGLERQVGIMELRCSEVLDSYFAARALFAKKGLTHSEDQAAARAFSEELETQYCYRMLLDPEATVAEARIFKSADEARAELSPDERGWFVERHQEFQETRVSSWTPDAAKPDAAKPDAAEGER
jgi:glutamate/tyrosine decarboxylase-like PLP-dependent enzyme